MTRIRARADVEDAMTYADGSVDSALTESAASMLRRVEAFLAEHPEMNGAAHLTGRIPSKRESNITPAMKMQA